MLEMHGAYFAYLVVLIHVASTVDECGGQYEMPAYLVPCCKFIPGLQT